MTALKGYAPTSEDLIPRHAELVRRIAWHMHERIGRRVEIEELLQAGYLGLVDAAQRYTPKKGVAFASYAAIRIRGSIVDYLRSSASMCRATMATRKRIADVTDKLSARLGHTPDDKDVAKELGMKDEELASWRSRIAASSTASLSDIYTDQSLAFMDTLGDAEDEVQATELKKLLRESLDALNEREALVLQLYYVEEMNVYEVGDVLGVTTGRVSQIKKAAVDKLRARMGELMGETIAG